MATAFYHIYHEINANERLLPEKANSFVQAGMEIVDKSDNIELKVDILTKFIRFFPQEPGFYFYMGFNLKKINPEQALPYYRRSYEISPNHLENMIDLIDTLFTLGKPQEVLDMDKNGFFDQFLHDIRFVVVYYQCLIDISYMKAIKYILHVIDHYTLHGCNTEKEREIFFYAHTHIANVYSSISEHELSVEFAEKSFEIAKQYRTDAESFYSAITTWLFESNFLYMDNQLVRQKCIELNKYMPSIPRFSFQYRKYQPNRKIKVAYLSSDFVGHAVSNFILPILKNHDKSRFDVFMICNNKGTDRQFTYLGLPCYNIVQMKDEDAAKFIYDLEIDILIELNGFTAKNRMRVLSFNPAPIQMTYLGYPNTTGLDFIKYRITDGTVDPISSTQYYAEKLVRLPRSFLLYESHFQSSPVTVRKTGSTIVLGSLNKENKLNVSLFRIWYALLCKYPNTKLLIKLDRADDYDERVVFYQKHLPLEKGRVLLVKKMDNEGYNNLFRQIDILLDTFPYSGTTTTCNALYNSIPVVTMSCPNSHVHNVSSSILTNMGLGELIARSVEEYTTIVEGLIENPARIEGYKTSIRPTFMELMEPKAFMRSYEDALYKV